MVYCINCGAKNPDDGVICTQCGRSIMKVESRARRESTTFEFYEYFGSIIGGLFLVAVGAVLFFRQFFPSAEAFLWPLVLILVGISILLSGLYGYARQ